MSDVPSWLHTLTVCVAISGVTIASALGSLLAIVRRVWRRFDAGLDARMTGLIAEVTTPRFDGVDNRLSSVEGRLDRVELRLDHLESDMTIVKHHLITTT